MFGKKRIFILCLITLIFLSIISVASAAEIQSCDVSDVADNEKMIGVSDTFNDTNLIVGDVGSVSDNSLSKVYVSTKGSDSGKGTIKSPFKTMETAISKVSNNGVIYVNSGIYSGVNNRDLTINKNLTIQSISGTVTLDAGNAGNAGRVFYIGQNVTLILKGLSLINGYQPIGAGGAIYNPNSNSQLTIINCIFKNNTGGPYGGAILSAGNLTIKNTQFIDNTALNGGGALWVSGDLTVDNCKFINNNVLGEGISCPAGAIMTAGNSTIKNTVFDKNSAGVVAGVLNRGTCLIDNCSFTNGFAGYCGGAISNRGVLIVNNSYFAYNYATFYAGVVLSPAGSQFIGMYNCIMEYNGAGLFSTVLNSYTSNFVFEKCSFYKNYIKANNKTKNYDPDPNNCTINTDGDIDALYNWWGSNELYPYYEAPGSQGYINASTWLVMNFSSDEELYTGKTSYLTVDLRHYFNNDTKTIEELEGDISLAKVVKFYTNKGEIKNNVILDNGIAKIAYTPTEGVTTVYAQIDDQILNISVNQRNYTSIIAKDLAVKVKEVKYYTVTLKDKSGNLLANKTVTFTLNGKTYTAQTNSNGQASLKINLAKAGTYTIKTTFKGDEDYVQSSVSKKITVKNNKVTTKILRVTGSTIKNYGYFKVKLVTSTGKVLANKKITLKVSITGKVYTIKTNKYGVARFILHVKPLGLGKTYTELFKFAGDSYYNGCTSSFKVKITR